MEDQGEMYRLRLAKRDEWGEVHPPAYPGSYSKAKNCSECLQLEDDTTSVKTAGRVMSRRNFGKLAFGHLQDASGRLQFALFVDALGKEDFDFILSNLDIGDWVGIEGDIFTTRKGEKSIRVTKLELLSKSLRQLPDKWHGLTDTETRARQRYLDLIANEESRQRFSTRRAVIRFLRNWLDDHDFAEVETPMLQPAASGASARPFMTHHHALDMPLYLRISPETWLKRLVAGGLERVYELGRNFRNEDMDRQHLQEFTMLEWYAAFWDWRDNLRFVEEMVKKMLQEVIGTLQVTWQGIDLDFSAEWKEITYRDLVLCETGIDLDGIDTREKLETAIKEQGFDFDSSGYIGLGALMDALYKRYCRPKLLQPTFVTMQPAPLVPLARRNDDDPQWLDMFQLLVAGQEVVKSYSELVNPIEQRVRMEEQLSLSKAGDDEAMMLEEDFIECMEYGMPPQSGLGFGVDRFITLITDAASIRDVVLFPTLKTISSQNEEIVDDSED